MMDQDERGILGDPQATGEQIRQAWQRAVIVAMEKHHKTGVPVSTWDWDRHRVVEILADSLSVSDDHALADQLPDAGKL